MVVSGFYSLLRCQGFRKEGRLIRATGNSSFDALSLRQRTSSYHYSAVAAQVYAKNHDLHIAFPALQGILDAYDF